MRILFTFLFFLLSVEIHSQAIVVKGKITDSEHSPLGGVIVKITRGNAMVGFTTSQKDGSYACEIPAGKDSLFISFRKLNYKEYRKYLPPQTKRLDVTLQRGDYQLREVTVEAPPVRVHSDTVLYNLGSFLQSGDHTLEDGLRRIPGIEIDDNGAISYMGRDIGNFYIEGLNLLGGRYNLATQNISAEKVTGVEVLRHHQANKVDKNELTDNVALNIKLSSKAKLKPFGAYEMRLGYRPDKLLYGAGGTAMLFRKDFQMLGTLKLANDGQMGRNALYDHFGRSSWSSSGEDALPLLSGSRPPMRESRYMNSSTELVSVNAIQRFTSDNQLKVNANYSHRRGEHDYQSITQYPETGGESLVIHENADYLQKEHQADLLLNYRSDKEIQLLENDFIVRGRFAQAESDIQDEALSNLAKQETNTYGIQNTLSWIRRVGKWKLNLGSTIRYTDTPDNTLDISQGDFSSHRSQQVRNHTFHTEETFHTSYQVLPALTLSLPATITVNANHLQTQLHADTLAVNAIQGWDYSLSVSPQMEYQTTDRRLRATIGLPLTFLMQDYCNEARALDRDFRKVYADWALELMYIPSGKVEWKVSSYLNQNFGDMMDLLVGPIQTDHRTVRTRSGIFGQTKQIRNNISFDWQEPLSFWHFKVNGSYIHARSNVQSGQNASYEDLLLTEIAHDNTSNSLSASMSVSKYLYAIKTNLLADASYYWQQNKRFSQDESVTTYNTGYMLMGRFTTNPIEQLQASYILSFQKDNLREGGTRNTSDRWRQQLSVAYTLWGNLRTEVRGEWQRNGLLENHSRSFSFLDASLEYKFRKPKLVLRLAMNNLLNVRSYGYTSYSQLNTYTYNYRLNGREFLLSIILN